MSFKAFAGLSLDQPRLMGVVNVTPDSFSDGGLYRDAQDAVDHAWKLIQDGADVLDIGGESTRPGADIVQLDEELDRVIPVIEGLRDANTRISIDTRNAAVMRAALDAGAHIINDVTALSHDKDAMRVATEYNCPVILMHMQKNPTNMQEDPTYENVVEDIYTYLQNRITACTDAGIKRENICVDVGIGFGKTVEHNLALLRNLSHFDTLSVPQLLGVSRKSFIGKHTNTPDAKDRLPGTIAATLSAISQGVMFHRVHDVKEIKQAITLWQGCAPQATYSHAA